MGAGGGWQGARAGWRSGGPGGAQAPPPGRHFARDPFFNADTIMTNYVIRTNPRLKLEAQRSRDSFSLFIFLNLTWLLHMPPAFPSPGGPRFLAPSMWPPLCCKCRLQGAKPDGDPSI